MVYSHVRAHVQDQGLTLPAERDEMPLLKFPCGKNAAERLSVLLVDEVGSTIWALRLAGRWLPFDRKVWYSGRLAKRTHLPQRYNIRTTCWSGNGTRVTSTLRIAPDTDPTADAIYTTTSGDTDTSTGSDPKPGKEPSPLIGY